MYTLLTAFLYLILSLFFLNAQQLTKLMKNYLDTFWEWETLAYKYTPDAKAKLGYSVRTISRHIACTRIFSFQHCITCSFTPLRTNAPYRAFSLQLGGYNSHIPQHYMALSWDKDILKLTCSFVSCYQSWPYESPVGKKKRKDDPFY